jgi:hypothetical protein
LTQGSTPETISTLSATYEIEFDIVVKDRIGLSEFKETNVFHIAEQTAQVDVETEKETGTRIPAVFVTNAVFKFCCGPGNECVDTEPYELDTVYHFRIFQEGSNFNVIALDNTLYPLTQNNPRDYTDLNLFLSDIWFESFAPNGDISNLRITDLTKCDDLNPRIVVTDGK